MKKIIIPIILIIIVFAMIVLIAKNEISNNTEIINNKTIQNNEFLNNLISGNEVEDVDMDMVYIKVNNQVLDIELEHNSATKKLKEKLKSGDIEIEAHEYGGFEKVGDLGFSLPREDLKIETSAGDIVLYQGNQISLFYNSNSWSYTKLGKIKNIDNEDLMNILGSGDVTIIFTLSR